MARSCQTLSALTHLLIEANEQGEKWKESRHKMEKNRNYWRKRAMDLEKKLSESTERGGRFKRR